jgi:hypothetical protein
MPFPLSRSLAYIIWPAAYGFILSVEAISLYARDILLRTDFKRYCSKKAVFFIIQEDHKFVCFASYEN